MSWAQRRKITYVISALFVVVVVLAITIFFVFSKTPTCSDGIQNQGEIGIDCGGPCSVLCRAQFSDPVLIWGPRWSKVLSSGTYNFLTYIENPNNGAGAFNAPYSMEIYDKENVLLLHKNGVTFIPPNNNFVVFEDGINLYDKVPARAVFEFTKTPVWQKMESMESSVTAVSKELVNENTKPKVLATLSNSTLKTIENIETVAILYDKDSNAIAFSKTKIDSINKDSTANVVFTWPETFSKKVVRIDIVSKVLPTH